MPYHTIPYPALLCPTQPYYTLLQCLTQLPYLEITWHCILTNQTHCHTLSYHTWPKWGIDHTTEPYLMLPLSVKGKASSQYVQINIQTHCQSTIQYPIDITMSEYQYCLCKDENVKHLLAQATPAYSVCSMPPSQILTLHSFRCLSRPRLMCTTILDFCYVNQNMKFYMQEDVLYLYKLQTKVTFLTPPCDCKV